jgi:hypothetical protein
MKNTILTICVIVGLWVAVISVPAMIVSDKYEIVKLDKANFNLSSLSSYGVVNEGDTSSIIDDCNNVYVNEKNISIEYGGVYAVKYTRHLSFDGKRYIIEAYKVNESPKDVICQGKQISNKEFYANV